MRKIIAVAVREYQAAVKTKAFLVMLVMMPVFMLGGIVFQMTMGKRVDTRDKRIAVVDCTGRLFDVLAQSAHERNTKHIFSGGTQIGPRFLLERVAPSCEDLDQVAFEMSQRVRNEAFYAFVIIPADVMTPRGTQGAPESEDDPVDDEFTGGPAAAGGVRYHSNTPTYGDVVRWLRPNVQAEIQRVRLTAAGIDPDVVETATAPVSVDNLGLVTRGQGGQIVQAQKADEIANFIAPFGLIMLMFLTVQVGAAPLISSVLEEKTQRIAEVLLGSVNPFSLMMGKLIGMVGVSLTLITIYLGGAYVAARRLGYGQYFPQHLVVWFAIETVLMVTLYGSIFIAIGSAVSDHREAQSMLMPAFIFLILPLMIWPTVVKEPLSPFSTFVSFIPPATPMLMTVRQAVPPGIPLWQPIVGAVLVLITTVGCVFLAGRIFRVGILMTGKGANLRQMLGWAFRG
ncbi:MAG: ABC transporter permease [Phycisphaerales bacterium]|nr:MAG: ABC transporter permease [Phycisphaerales bacterium]